MSHGSAGAGPRAPLACRAAVCVGRGGRPANEVGRRVDYTPRGLLEDDLAEQRAYQGGKHAQQQAERVVAAREARQ